MKWQIKKKKHKEGLKELREKAKARPYQLKYRNQVIARKEKTILNLQKKIKGKIFEFTVKEK